MANNEDYVGYIRCSNCGKAYKVVGNDIFEEDLIYHCSNCNSDIHVPFFTYCKHCDEFVGIDNGTFRENACEIVGKAISGYLRPASAISNIGRFFDNIPSANGWGVCKFCNTKYIRCPRCNEPIEVKPGTGDNDVLFCPDCGQRMRQP